MMLNGSKFQVMSFGQSVCPPTYLDNEGNPIEVFSSVRDLGVTLQADGKFNIHLSEKVAKAAQMSGWVLRTFKSRETTAMLALYSSIIQPHLDYASLIWSPCLSGDRSKMENILRRFTRQIAGLSGLSYWDRLRELSLYSVERRHERYVILHAFKCIHGLTHNPGIKFTHRDNERLLCLQPYRGHNESTATKLLMKYSFLERGPKLFNKLPTSLRRIYFGNNPLADFKRDLDVFLQRIPDQPTVPGCPRSANTNSIVDQIHYRSP